MREPAPDVLLDAFADSAVNYRVRFWVYDFGRDSAARDQVRSNIWYTFKRHGIEIPFPIQVEYQREEKAARPPGHVGRLAERLGQVDLFSEVNEDERAQLASICREHGFGAGERVVKQGDAGQSMFVVLEGQVRVTLEPSGQQVATITAGGFFGEMSMLTGDPRSATVSALGDATLLEIDAERFRALAMRCPGLVERVTALVSSRRVGLAEAQAAADQVRADGGLHQTLLSRIRAFLDL